MPLQTHNRDWAEQGTADDKAEYQKYEHPEEDLVNYVPTAEPGHVLELGERRFASVRIYCPDVRVISRIGVIFQPLDPNDSVNYDLSATKSDIVAYRCMNAKSRVARVGEIVGKNGVPLEFPKSDIDGIAFQNEDDMPFIDVDMNLAFPGVAGKWSIYYHATANNKLKYTEWRAYISRVTMSQQACPGTVLYSVAG